MCAIDGSMRKQGMTSAPSKISSYLEKEARNPLPRKKPPNCSLPELFEDGNKPRINKAEEDMPCRADLIVVEFVSDAPNVCQ